jgi:DNA-binding transcriptional regulator YiaG
MVKLDKNSRRMNTKKMAKPLRTVAAIIAAMGVIEGAAPRHARRALADWCGVGETAVCNWEADKHIPTGWHLRLYLHLQDHGYAVDPRAFGCDKIATPKRQTWGRRAA